MDQENRTINKGILQGWTIVGTILFLAYVLEVVKGNRTIGYFTVFALLLVVPLVIAWTVYRKNEASGGIKYLCAVFYGILYVFVLLTGATPLVFSYSLPVLYLLMLSNDAKLLKWLAVGNISANLASIVVQIVVDHKKPAENMTEWEIQVAAAVMCSIFAYMACCISSRLHGARVNAMAENEQKLKSIFEKVTEVTGGVEKDTEKLLEKLVELRESAGRTASAMEEIVNGSAQSTQMVERQLHMTSDIQAIVDRTGGLTERINKSVGETTEKVNTGILNMQKLSGSAKEVEENSRQVITHMEMLKETTGQVQGIIDIISGIAGQTNLLALNASIEAARAGEAGRGFAVVAEEINGLANQTKDSTQSIAQMVGTLREKASEAALAVARMAELNTQQNDIIFATGADFDVIHSAVENVKRDMDEESEQIKKLVLANAQIVESIQTISAVSEEVMANTAQTQEVTEQNGRAVDGMNTLARELERRVVELRSYM